MRLNDSFGTFGKMISYLIIKKEKIVVENYCFCLDEIYSHVLKKLFTHMEFELLLYTLFEKASYFK